MSKTPHLPDGIEVFRAGTRAADDGTVYTITEADVAAAAAAYDPALHEAPLVVGHPASNHPAYGWVAGLQAQGGVLLTSHRQVEPQFAEMVQAGRFKKRSASFYAPTDPSNPKPGVWYLRHVGFLGAQPPAVKGLKDVAFSEAAGAVNFSQPITHPQEQSTMKTAEQLQQELDAEKERSAALERERNAEKTRADENARQVASFSEAEKARTHAAHVSFAEAQVKVGTVLPKDQGTVVAVLDSLAAAQPVSFSEGGATKTVSAVEFVKGLIEAAKPKVAFGEHLPGGVPHATLAQKGDSDADIDRKARAFMADKKVSYSEALQAVTASFSA